jgi:hypothetical protein
MAAWVLDKAESAKSAAEKIIGRKVQKTKGREEEDRMKIGMVLPLYMHTVPGHSESVSGRAV